MDWRAQIQSAYAAGEISKDLSDDLIHFITTYLDECGHNTVALVNQYISLVLDANRQAPSFEYFHKAETTPFNYQQFSLDFIRPLIDFDRSTLEGKASIEQIEEALMRKENVILLANHQTEPDPQIIQLLLENKHPHLAKSMSFVAGDRVVRDPQAIPLSRGSTLFCIYSKRYVDHPPEKREEKLQHNQRTLRQIEEQLKIGGLLLYVAPSGGRDRPDASGHVSIAPPDEGSLELFFLLGKRSPKPVHFYPLTLSTYAIMPPPNKVIVSLGESRRPKRAPVHIHFGKPITIEQSDVAHLSKKEQRLYKKTRLLEALSLPYNQWHQ